MPPGEQAGALFERGMNCAQAVLRATTGRDEPQLMEICAAFGSGIGGAKCLCGAVSGGVMALALQGEGSKSGNLVQQFRARHKTTCCKGLSAPFRWGSREHLANCRQITEQTAELVAQLIHKKF